MHPAFMINQIWSSQNRIFFPAEPELKEVVHEVIAATKSEELLAQMIEELKGIREDFEQDRAELALQEGPYSGVLRFAPQSRDEWYNFLNLLLAALVLLFTLMQKGEPSTVVIQDQEQEIVQQLKEIKERLPADSPEDDNKPKEHR